MIGAAHLGRKDGQRVLAFFRDRPIFSPVPRLLRLLACALLAVWLPATMHCQIEAAGLRTSATECCEHDVQGCADTICPSIEQNLIKDTSPVTVSPALDGCECHFCAVPAVACPAHAVILIFPFETATPPELAVRWQFLARAVAPARAP